MRYFIRYVSGTDINFCVHKHTIGSFATYQEAIDKLNESPNPDLMEVVER